MPTNEPLFLHEEIMLLALRDEEGTIVSGTMCPYALGGAIVAELLLHERVGVAPTDKKKRVNVIDPTPIGEPLLDECLERLSSAKRRAGLQSWVSRFASLKNLKHRVAEQLCRLGVLRADEDKVLLLFTRKIYRIRMTDLQQMQLRSHIIMEHAKLRHYTFYYHAPRLSFGVQVRFLSNEHEVELRRHLDGV